ncbi:hypothetical protein ALP66_03815 [Pseudomonas amygdali pv. photiniae]|uniref:Uncharacterized protein n=1 Tax=Pseudomonas amygdali pv. photiniae TaxID=251724 RepID=A0A658KG72_PSEA0|nr:hypothetical protein ALP66_03815 [Pseudomonas amygdali pv. photiniae]
MAALASQGDFEGVQRCHHRPWIDHHLASRHARPVVQTVDRFHRKALEQTVFDHPLRAAEVFLGRLKDKMHCASKPAGFRQVPGGGQQNCRMAIVSAGMHAALMGRLVHAVAQLLNRQSVHVGTNADGRAVAIAQGADHASTAQTAVHLNAEATQQISHLVRGFQLLKPQLRRSVDRAAPDSCFVDQCL